MNQTQWGSTIEDLAISLSTEQSVFRPGDSIKLNIALKNVGATPATIVVRSPWIDFDLSVRDESGNELPPTQFLQMKREASVEGRLRTQKLMPGEAFVETVDLDKAYNLNKTGLYKVSAKHHTSKGGTLDQFVEVPSNELTFRIAA